MSSLVQCGCGGKALMLDGRGGSGSGDALLEPRWMTEASYTELCGDGNDSDESRCSCRCRFERLWRRVGVTDLMV